MNEEGHTTGVFEVAQLTKELEESSRECDRYKIAHLTSEAEKKDLIIENLKIAHAMSQLESENKALNTKMECEAKLKAKETECLQKLEVEWKSRISQLEDAVKSAKIGEKFENTEQTIHWICPYSVLSVNIQRFIQPPVKFAGTIWHLSVDKVHSEDFSVDKFSRRRAELYKFRFYLHAVKDGFAWICPVAIEFQLLSPASKEVVYHRSSEYTFNNLSAKSGIIATVSDTDLEKIYVQNDSFEVAVVIKILPTN